MVMMIPDYIENESQLDDIMSTPSAGLIEMMKRLSGDIMILGIAGKMGHTLGRQAVRAIEEAGVQKKVIGVSRFSDSSMKEKIGNFGIENIGCDLLDPGQVEELPLAENVIFMAGRKFGTGGNEHFTWAMNTTVPAICARKFKSSRIVAFSTGCVYPLISPESGGSREVDSVGPVGEYSMSCLGRERVFEHYSTVFGTRAALVRLNYAIDMRYGVLYDIASKIINDGTADLTVPDFNAIWQGDATDQILRVLEHCDSPPFIINVTGPEQVSTREAALKLAELMGVDVDLQESTNKLALLSNSSIACALFGNPRISMDTLIRWTAHWVKNGGSSLGKPTHFEVKDGKY
ncbi:MAG: NAD-dependent epimerase/dehydratase family protein [Spirochaetales bacterium]|nr:NAD-dependent epimerase/dehydratase family protein [Spirochaetales bacterium]